MKKTRETAEAPPPSSNVSKNGSGADLTINEDTESLLSGGDPSFSDSEGRRNLSVLSGGFLLLFIAFNATQNLQTSLNDSLGYNSLATLYVVFAFSSLFSAWAVRFLEEKASIFLGGVAYELFIAANISPKEWTLLSSAGLLGIGAALIWTGQGSYLSKCSSEKTLATNAGLFFAIFQFNQIIGNLLVGLVFGNHGSQTFLFALFASMGGVALFIFLAIKNVAPKKELPSSSAAKTSLRLLETLKLLGDRKMILLFAPMLYSGISQSYFFGNFPKTIKLAKSKTMLGYVMAIFGTADASSSYLFGRLTQRFGYRARRLILTWATCCTLTGALLSRHYQHSSSTGIFIVAALLMGSSDGGYNTQLYSLLGSLFNDDDADDDEEGEKRTMAKKSRATEAFAAFKFFQAFSTGAAFFYGKYVSYNTNTLIIIIMVLLGFPSYLFLEHVVLKHPAHSFQVLEKDIADIPPRSNSPPSTPRTPSTPAPLKDNF